MINTTKLNTVSCHLSFPEILSTSDIFLLDALLYKNNSS